MKETIKIIAFDADDTLWVNENHFQDVEKTFCELLCHSYAVDKVSAELLKTEMENLALYGYGAKGFTLCMIETLDRLSNGQAPLQLAAQIIALGKKLLKQPTELITGVHSTLEKLTKKYKLVLATKGDLLDQERKLNASGLNHFFDHVEIMSDKQTVNYERLLKRLNCKPKHFLMVGNSLKSDILPVLELGGHAAYIPYHLTWVHERSEIKPLSNNFVQLNSIDLLTDHLQ